jgi:hypothetical protein
MLYGTVPGGAGHVQRIAERLSDVLDKALGRSATASADPKPAATDACECFATSATTNNYAVGGAADVLGRILGRADHAPAGALRISLSDVHPA